MYSAQDVSPIGGADVVSAAVPAMMHALNATNAIVTRLENLAKHPVVKLSLGGGNGD